MSAHEPVAFLRGPGTGMLGSVFLDPSQAAPGTRCALKSSVTGGWCRARQRLDTYCL